MQTAPTILSWPTRPGTPPNRAHIAIGVTVSLLLHLLFAAWSWQHRVGGLHFPEQTTISVHLLPPIAEKPAPILLPPQPVKPQKSTAIRTAQTPAVKPHVVVTTQAPEAQPVPPAPSPQQPEKHLDMNAIYGSVKSAVAEVDRENAETPVGQLAAKPLYPPEGDKMAKMIDRTTRQDCLEKVSGYGLFAPLVAAATLLDKKDTGCKWR